MSGTVHFVVGPTGAGKSTHAATLGGVFFSIDAWMAALFWADRGDPIDPVWAMARVERCRALIWRTALDVALAGGDVVLEIGLTTKALRADFAARAEAAGVAARLHWVDAEREERWRRVERRNASGGELDFPISRAMFDYVEGLWEAPDGSERAERVSS